MLQVHSGYEPVQCLLSSFVRCRFPQPLALSVHQSSTSAFPYSSWAGHLSYDAPSSDYKHCIHTHPRSSSGSYAANAATSHSDSENAHYTSRRPSAESRWTLHAEPCHICIQRGESRACKILDSEAACVLRIAAQGLSASGEVGGRA